MELLFYICVFIGLFLYIINKNNKTFCCFIIFAIILLACSPRVGYDTKNFILMYDMVRYKGVDFVATLFPVATPYLILTAFFIDLGVVSFFVCKFLVLSVLILTVVLKYKKIVYFPVALLTLYMLSTFSVDAIQFRNTIALCFFLIGFYYFVFDNNNGSIKFLFFNTISSLFHVSFIIYFLLMLTNMNEVKLKHIIKPLFSLTTIFYLVLLFNQEGLSVIRFIIDFISYDKLLRYAEFSTRWGSLMPFFLSTSQIMLLGFIYKEMKTRKINDLFMISLTRIIYYLNIIVFPTILLTLFSLSVARFMRNLVPLNLLVLTNVLFVSGFKIRYRWFYKFLLFSIFFFYLIYTNFLTGPADDILFAIIKGDFFWVE